MLNCLSSNILQTQTKTSADSIKTVLLILLNKQKQKKV